MLLSTHPSAPAQTLDPLKLRNTTHLLEDVMEMIDTTAVKLKLNTVETAHAADPTVLNRLRLGIICHETALNLSFLSKTAYKGYAKKSYDLLTALMTDPVATPEMMPFIESYRASALALTGAETQKLNLLGVAFGHFEAAVKRYGAVSCLPQFLRGSVAENLPWFFVNKRKFAKRDFQAIIDKQAANSAYADWKIMSFTYWAWAKQHKGKQYRQQAIQYLDKAIGLDPQYQAGRAKAEALKREWTK